MSEVEYHRLVIDSHSFGITSVSLKVLCDAIAESAKHNIYVVEVPTPDECCAYMIFDRDSHRL